MKHKLSVLLVFGVAFAAGYLHMDSSPLPAAVTRDPAAVSGVFDLSNLSGEPLHIAVKNRLLKGIDINGNNQEMLISLGHFIFTTENGVKRLACQEFEKVVVTFQAEGASVSGEKPLMTVEGACEASLDLSAIVPLRVPVRDILRETPADGEFQYNLGTPVSIGFNNLPDQWPRTWLLNSVKLIKSDRSGEIAVENDELIRTIGRPVVVTW